MSFRSLVGFTAACGLSLATTLRAQCPDGGEPPCARRSSAPPALSIAILDFANRSRDTSDTFLADGIADEIATRLGQIDRFVVTSRSQVKRIRNAATMPIPDLGRTLNVAYLVAGSVQRAGTRLRVNIEVLRARDARQLFAELYDRDREGLLDVQADVAAAVAGVVSGRLLPSDKVLLTSRPTRSPEAYEHYVRGNQHFAHRSITANALAAVREYRTAVAIDSTFADAWAALARAGSWVYRYGVDITVPHDSLARLALARARHLAPGSAATIVASAELRRDDESALQDLRNLVKRFPLNTDLVMGLAVLEFPHNLGNALTLAERAAALEARNPRITQALATWYVYDRRFGMASRYADRLVAHDPSNPDAYLIRAAVALMSATDTIAIRADIQRAVERLGGQSLVDAPNWALYPLMRFDSTLLAAADRMHPMPFAEYAWIKMWRALALRQAQVARIYADSVLQLNRASHSRLGAHGGEFWVADALVVLDRQNEIDATRWDPGMDPYAGYERARLFAAIGRFDAALDILEELAQTPSTVSRGLLRMDPGMAPLKGQIRFERLVSSSP